MMMKILNTDYSADAASQIGNMETRWLQKNMDQTTNIQFTFNLNFKS